MAKKVKKHQLMGETDSHFMIHDGKAAFPVAKKGLSENVQNSIRKLSKFSEGGDVKPAASPTPAPSPKTDDYQVGDPNSVGAKITKKVQSLVSGYADGGEVSEEELLKKKEETDKANRKKMDLGEDQDEYPNDVKNLIAGAQGVRHYDDGGDVAPMQVATDPSQVQPPVEQAPVTQVQLPPVPASMQSQDPNAIPEAVLNPPAERPFSLSSVGDVVRGLAGASPAPQVSQQPQMAQELPDQGPAVQPKGDDQNSTFTKGLLDSFGLQRKGILAQQNAISAGEAQKAQAETELQKELKAKEIAHWGTMQDLNDRSEKLYQAVQDGKVDPNHYWDSKSTINKIGSAIAIALGGLAQGYSAAGGNHNAPNMALNIINGAIDRDIQAQMTNLNQKNNAFKANLELTRNEQEAYDRSKLDALTLAKAKVDQASATANSQAARAQGQILSSELDRQMGMMKAQMGAMNASNPNGPTPGSVRMAIMSGMIPKDQQGNAIKELGQYGVIKQALDNTDKVFNVALNNATYSNRVLPSWFPTVRDKSKIYDAVTHAWLGNITKETEGRVTPQDVELMAKSLPVAGDSPQVRAQKLGYIKSMIAGKSDFPTLKTYGLISPGYNAASGTTQGGAIRFTPLK